MLTRPKINTTYPTRYPPSISFSSTNYSKYLTYLLNKFRGDFQTPLQTWPVYRTNLAKLPKLNEHKFVSLHIS